MTRLVRARCRGIKHYRTPMSAPQRAARFRVVVSASERLQYLVRNQGQAVASNIKQTTDPMAAKTPTGLAHIFSRNRSSKNRNAAKPHESERRQAVI